MRSARRLLPDDLEREVIAFISQNHIDANLAVELFVLRTDGGDAESRAGGRAEP